MVKPYRKLVGDWINAKDNATTIWKQLEDRWQEVVKWAETTDRQWKAGSPMPWPHRDAAQEVLKLNRNVKTQVVIETVVAMGYMFQADPRRFRDDHAFRTQLVRRTRGLTDVNAGSWYDHDTSKVKRVYRELRPKSSIALAKVLIDALGVVGLMIHGKVMKAEAQTQKTKQSLYDALEVA